MPLNTPKTGSFKPTPVGPVILKTRSAVRARLRAGGTYFRSKERGELQNLIKIAAFEDTSIPEAALIVQHTQLKPSEQLFPSGVSPELELLKADLAFNEKIVIAYDTVTSQWRAAKQGIRWQVAPGPEPFPAVDLGQVRDGAFSAGGVTFRLSGLASWPTGATVELRPRTHRYTLVALSVTDPATSVATTGYDIEALRGALGGDDWVSMPARGTKGDATAVPPTLPTTGSDAQDKDADEPVLTPFAFKNLSGGDGLPSAPVGLNTGPDRVLIHLN